MLCLCVCGCVCVHACVRACVCVCVQLMKSIQTVSGKDLSHFMEQWVCRNGVPRFYASFSYMRKKNQVELRLKQDLPRGYSKFVVSKQCKGSSTCITYM